MSSLTLTFTPHGTYQCPGLGSTRDLAVIEALGLDPILEQRGCSDCPVFASCKMSHWTSVEVNVTDERALQSAAEELGCTWQIGGFARGYVASQMPGDYVIKVPNSAYDVAVKKTAEGKCTLVTDWYRGTVEAVVGKNYGTLLQRYGIHKAQAAARTKGYTTRRTVQENGNIQLTINVP